MDKTDIGALWVRKSKKEGGEDYMTGTVSIGGVAYQVVVFKNSYKKEGSSQPDFRIYPSTPKPEAAPAPEAGSTPF